MSDDMNEKEMINNLIDNYTSLQRIKKAENSEKESKSKGQFRQKESRNRGSETRETSA